MAEFTARRNGSMMLYSKKPERWRIQWSLGYCDTPAGRRWRTSSKVVDGTRHDARRQLDREVEKVEKGVTVEPARTTLAEYAERYVAGRINTNTRTRQDYSETLARYVLPSLGALELRKVTASRHLEPLLVEMRRRRPALSPRVCQMVYRLLKSMFAKAVAQKLVAENPMMAVERPAGGKVHEPHIMKTAEEAHRFLAAARADRHGIVFAFALETGMRPSEYCGLAWSDLDFDAGVIHVRRSLVRLRGGGFEIGDCKTEKSKRTLALSTPLLDELRSHRARQAKHRLGVGPAYNGKLDLLFADDLGNPLHDRNLVQRCFKPLLKRAGLPSSMTLYGLRHAAATLMIDSGESVKTVQAQLGHSDSGITLRVYAQAVAKSQAAAAARLGSLLRAPEECSAHGSAHGEPAAVPVLH